MINDDLFQRKQQYQDALKTIERLIGERTKYPASTQSITAMRECLFHIEQTAKQAIKAANEAPNTI